MLRFVVGSQNVRPVTFVIAQAARESRLATLVFLVPG